MYLVNCGSLLVSGTRNSTGLTLVSSTLSLRGHDFLFSIYPIFSIVRSRQAALHSLPRPLTALTSQTRIDKLRGTDATAHFHAHYLGNLFKYRKSVQIFVLVQTRNYRIKPGFKWSVTLLSNVLVPSSLNQTDQERQNAKFKSAKNCIISTNTKSGYLCAVKG